MCLKLWRANVDFQVIANIHAVIKYIAKYTTKSEIRSTGLCDFLKGVVENIISVENETTKSLLQKAMMKICNERDYCAQETMFFINSLEYYRCSRPFVT